MLIDCGTDIKRSLEVAALKPSDIDSIYISHLHADHVGGLEYIGFSSYFSHTNKPKLFISEVLLNPLWNNVLSGGMSTIQGKICRIDDFFSINSVGKNKLFNWEEFVFIPIQVIHIMDGFSINPAFGLLFKVNDKTIFLTTDTQYAPSQINEFYNKADIIVHDCEMIYAPDGSPIFSGVHAHYEELKKLSDPVKEKIWLVHYQEESPIKNETTIDDGFLGMLQPRIVIA